MYSHFQLSYPSIRTNKYRCQDLRVVMEYLYRFIFNEKNVILSNIKVVCYYMDIPYTTFNIVYNKGIHLCVENNCLRIASLYPEFEVLDTKLAGILGKNNYTNLDDKRINIKSSQNLKENIHSKFDEMEHANDNKISFSNTKNEIASRIDQIKKFESDKYSYSLIKNDMEKGLTDEEKIHPDFMVKYQIFKILESRKTIDLNTNKNIVDEYSKFIDMYQAYLENECDNKLEISPQKNVYVPHNYNYLVEEEKEQYAKKYQMSRQQFENEYVNKNFQSDMKNDII